MGSSWEFVDILFWLCLFPGEIRRNVIVWEWGWKKYWQIKEPRKGMKELSESEKMNSLEKYSMIARHHWWPTWSSQSWIQNVGIWHRYVLYPKPTESPGCRYRVGSDINEIKTQILVKWTIIFNNFTAAFFLKLFLSWKIKWNRFLA